MYDYDVFETNDDVRRDLKGELSDLLTKKSQRSPSRAVAVIKGAGPESA